MKQIWRLLLAGVQYPLEAQVIMTISQDDLSTCPASGCQIGLSVLFTLFDEAEKINLFLDSIIPYIPYSGAVCLPFCTMYNRCGSMPSEGISTPCMI